MVPLSRISPRRATAVAAMTLTLPVIAAAQETLQFNVPYRCQDGTTNVITRCEKTPRGEVCFWREEQNGQVIGERYNRRDWMDGWLKVCRPPQATPAPRATVAPPAAPAPSTAGPAPDSPFLAGLPSVDRIMREIQGTSPTDTLARQMAAFTYVSRLVLRMQMAPGRPFNSVTPDERRVTDAYSAAAYQATQAYLKAASPEDATALPQLVSRYESNVPFGDQVFAMLSPASRAEFGRVNGNINTQAQARIDQQRRENEQARTQPPAAAAGATGVTGVAGINSPGGAAIRRCLELGGSNGECLGQGFTTDFLGLGGLNDLSVFSGPSGPAGLRIGGTYTAAAGLAIGFTNENANLSGCGKLESDARRYSVTRRGNQLQVEIQNTPTPLVVLLGPDGTFSGPSAFAVTGNVIVGYNRYWVETRNADGSIVVGSGHEERTPIYEPKTERCGFASLRATAPAHAETSVIGLLAGGLDGQAAALKSGFAEVPAGPRMSGTYAGAGGLQLEFRTTAVVVDCGEAHVRQSYAVENLADRLVVTVRNGTVPLTLTLQPDGTLNGSGTVEVAGRVVTGTNAAGVTFAPRNVRCPVGPLAAR